MLTRGFKNSEEKNKNLENVSGNSIESLENIYISSFRSNLYSVPFAGQNERVLSRYSFVIS